MKKGLLLVAVLVSSALFFSGCIKNTPYTTTVNPSMTASIGSYNFVAATTYPATLDTQIVDTSHTLIITGTSSDKAHPYDRISVSVANYKGTTGTYSIIQGQANAYYYHNNVLSPASGGVVSITSISSTVISGYFSFNTVTGDAITNGKFTVGTP